MFKLPGTYPMSSMFKLPVTFGLEYPQGFEGLIENLSAAQHKNVWFEGKEKG
jgi:hypothetical protein